MNNYSEIINSIYKDFSLNYLYFTEADYIDVEFEQLRGLKITAPICDSSKYATIESVSNLCHELGHFLTCTKKQLRSERDFGFENTRHPKNINNAFLIEANALAYQGFLLNKYTNMNFEDFWEFEMETFLDTFLQIYKRIPNESLYIEYLDIIDLDTSQIPFQKFHSSQENNMIRKGINKNIKKMTLKIFNAITEKKIELLKKSQDLLCEV